MEGLYNGLELAIALLEGRDPVYRTEEDLAKATQDRLQGKPQQISNISMMHDLPPGGSVELSETPMTIGLMVTKDPLNPCMVAWDGEEEGTVYALPLNSVESIVRGIRGIWDVVHDACPKEATAGVDQN
jgi:hypothetical protein